GTGAEAVASFNIDYDSLSLNDAAFFWRLNQNFTGGNDMNYALVVFDTLQGLDFTGYDYASHAVVVDTIGLLLSHRNSSGQADTVTISIIELDADDYFTNNTLWEFSFTSDSSLTSAVNSFLRLELTPGIALCDGKFGVRVDFDGPTNDTLGIIAGFRRSTCANTTCASGNPGAFQDSPYWPSSYYQIQNGPNSPVEVPTPTGGDFYRDCSGDMSYTPGGCEDWYIQNFLIDVDVSISDQAIPALTATTGSTPNSGGGDGTAYVTPAGGIGDYTVIWATSPIQRGDTARNLTAGDYDVLITNGLGCDTLNLTVTVEGAAAGLEEELAAGINGLEVFPNPSQGTFTVAFELDQIQDIAVEVFTLQGQKVFASAQNNVRDFRQSLNLQDMPAGIYMLGIRTEKGIAYKRIILE
ncbi:MAG: T9SS type A sorting domain-containing protein, partial [Bacteroidota bacterium]